MILQVKTKQIEGTGFYTTLTWREIFSMCVYYFKNWWHLQIQLDHQSSCDPFKIWFIDQVNSHMTWIFQVPCLLSCSLFLKKLGKYEWKINIWNILGILNDNNLSTCSEKLFFCFCLKRQTWQVFFIYMYIFAIKKTHFNAKQILS